MTLAKASEVNFHFPLIGWFDDGVRTFPDREYLLKCRPALYENDELIGMELVDNSLRRWAVRSVDLCSPLPKKRWYHNRLLFFVFLPITFFLEVAYNTMIEIDPRLEELAPLDLEEVKAQVIREKGPIWADFDPVGSPEYDAELAKVRDAPDVAALVDLLEEDWPPGFLE